MDVRQYADLFLSESRDHLTAFNHLLLDWERDPTAQDPVGGIFRAVRARSIRVDQRRLDQLMNLIGELAIARGRLRTLTAKQDDHTSARCRW